MLCYNQFLVMSSIAESIYAVEGNNSHDEIYRTYP